PDLDDVLRRSRGGGGGGGGGTAKSDPPRARPRGVPPPEPAAPPKTRAEDRLKELYRTLVQKLHPDKGGRQTPRERGIRAQLQAAYQANDLDAMEALAGRLEVSMSGNGRHLPVHILLRMTRDLKEVLLGMQAQIRKLKALPAWNFRSRAAKLEKHAET